MLNGRSALVTGGGRGIGEAIARKLAEEGANVLITGRTEGELRRVAESIGGAFRVCDLGDRASLSELLEFLANRPIDILINNAGIASSAPLAKTTDQQWDDLFEVNVRAPFALCRALAGPMAARGFGRIINIASNAGRTGYPYTSAYCASKHALVGLTRALATEFASTEVTINAVCPGWVKTDMSASAIAKISQKTGRSPEEAEKALVASSPQGRMVLPDEVAHLVASLCHPAARSMHGQSLVMDGGQVMA